MSIRVVVAGSLNTDLAAFLPRLPRPGEAIHAREVRRDPGGRGFNQAVAARRLGAEVRMLGAVGDDPFGLEFERRLDQLQIGRRGVRRVEAPTGLAVPMVTEGGENATVVSLGANLELRPEHLTRTALRGDVLLLQGELRPETTIAAAERFQGLVVLNAAPASFDLSPAVAHAGVVVVNELEAADMGGSDRLLGLGAGAVVVTLGRRGAMVDNTVVPAPRVVAVDSTGADDAFCAALGVALGEGRPLMDAIAWAVRAGAAACMRPGSSDSMPTRDEVDALAPLPLRPIS